MSIVDTTKLGLRQRTVQVYKSVVNPQTGLRQMRFMPEVITERQPILTPDEAAVLVDADWEESPPHEQQWGKYRCKVNGSGFFCSENPAAKAEAKAKVEGRGK